MGWSYRPYTGAAQVVPDTLGQQERQIAVERGAPVPAIQGSLAGHVSDGHRTFESSGERDKLRLRALAMGVPYLHLPLVLPTECQSLLDAALACQLRALPVGRSATALTVALDARWNARTLFRLRVATGLEIFPVLTLPEEMDRALAHLAGC
jgi:hypothetical protein